MPEGEAAGEAIVDLLDRLIDTGVVAAGDAVISLAGVDLVYVNLRLLLASVLTASDQAALPVGVAVPAGQGAGRDMLEEPEGQDKLEEPMEPPAAPGGGP